MTTTLDLTNVTSVLTSISLYFVFALLGAFIKDLYGTITKRDETINIKRIIIGATFSAFLVFGLENKFITQWGLNFTVSLSFIVGVLGFELFGKWVKIEFFERWFRGRNE